MAIKSNYWHNTPKRWRMIGDSILLGSASLSAIMLGAPIPENAKTWTIFILNVAGVAGKILTNLFKENDTQDKR